MRAATPLIMKRFRSLFGAVVTSSSLLVACGGDIDLGNDVHDGGDEDSSAYDAHESTTDTSSDSSSGKDGKGDGGAESSVDAGPDVLSEAGCCTVPPTFAGVKSVDAPTTTSLHLTWNPAADACTSAAAMHYEVFMSTSPSSVDFTAPVLAVVGSTEVVVGGLLQGTTYFVVVRASNGCGTMDVNTVIKSGTTTSDCTFPLVEKIFDLHCAKSGCHVIGGAAPFPLIAGAAYKQIVNVPSSEVPSMPRITPGDSSKSYLYWKIVGGSGGGGDAGDAGDAPEVSITGSIMPPSGAGVDPLSAEEVATIKQWIDRGACEK